MKNRSRISWGDLPGELLEAIALRLGTRSEVCHFWAVCKQWRRSAPSSLTSEKPFLSPFLPYTLRFSYPKLSTESLVLVANSAFLLRSSMDPTKLPWLVSVEEFKSGKLYLRKPLSKIAIQEFPEKLPRLLDLSHFHVSEIFRGYCLRLKDNVGDLYLDKKWCDYRITKVVLFVNPASSLSNPSINDCIAVFLSDRGDLLAIRLGQEEGNVKRIISSSSISILNLPRYLYATCIVVC